MKAVAFYLLALAVIVPTVAAAQQPQQTPMEMAVAGKLQEEYNQNLQLRSALIGEQQKSAALQKQIDDLKAKYEPPKKDEPKNPGAKP